MAEKSFVGEIAENMCSIKRQYPFYDHFNLLDLFCFYIKHKDYVFDIESLEKEIKNINEGD